MENPDVVLEMQLEDDLVDKEGKKKSRAIFSYKNYSRDKDMDKSAMEFGTIMCSMLGNVGMEDNDGKED